MCCKKTKYLSVGEARNVHTYYCGKAKVHSLLIKHLTFSPMYKTAYLNSYIFIVIFMIGYWNASYKIQNSIELDKDVSNYFCPITKNQEMWHNTYISWKYYSISQCFFVCNVETIVMAKLYLSHECVNIIYGTGAREENHMGTAWLYAHWFLNVETLMNIWNASHSDSHTL